MAKQQVPQGGQLAMRNSNQNSGAISGMPQGNKEIGQPAGPQ
jgi:hypothetical protein